MVRKIDSFENTNNNYGIQDKKYKPPTTLVRRNSNNTHYHCTFFYWTSAKDISFLSNMKFLQDKEPYHRFNRG
jgi:hypothetical protein